MEDGTRKDRWWEVKQEHHKTVFDNLATLLDKNSKKREELYVNHRLYGTIKPAVNWIDESLSEYMTRLKLNVIKMGCDTAQARIAKNRPKPMFSTEMGKYQMKRKGEKLGKYIEGVYEQNETFESAQDVFLESSIGGLGGMKIYTEDKKVKHERAQAQELVFDFNETRYGKVYTLYQIKFMDAWDAAAIWKAKGEKRSKIINSGRSDSWSDTFYEAVYGGTQIPVVEAWRVPVGDMKGAHFIGTSDCTIKMEEWKMDEVPFEFFSYNNPLFGVWGNGIADELRGMQVEINKTLTDIQDIIHLGCVPKIFVKYGSEVVTQQFNNEIGSMITYEGEAPIAQQLMKVPQELWVHLNFLYNKSFEKIGLNQQAASGSVSDKLASGKAIREHNDIEQERFSIIAQNYERFHKRLWKKTLQYSKHAADSGGIASVLSFSKKGVQKIDWKDVDMETDAYLMKIFPVSVLSKSPQGKIADVKELLDMGMIDGQEGLYLLDFPDTEKFFKFKNAAKTSFEAIVDNIVDDGKMEPPSPIYGLNFLALGVNFMVNSYLFYKNEGLEPEKQELFTRWINEANAIMIEMQQAQQGLDEQPEMPIDEGAIAEQMIAEAEQAELGSVDMEDQELAASLDETII